MKKIQDLQPHEAVEIRTKKEAKKLAKVLNNLGYMTTTKEVVSVEFIFDKEYPFLYIENEKLKYIDVYAKEDIFKVIYHASEFLPKKKKWKKEAFIEIARLDSEVNELRHMLAKDMPVTVSEDVKLEVGKWYKVYLIGEQSQRALICIESINDIEVHFFGFRLGEWVEKDWMNICHTYKPATLEEVKSALIKEAEKRGYKPQLQGEESHFEHNFIIYDAFSYGRNVIFYNGKWA